MRAGRRVGKVWVTGMIAGLLTLVLGGAVTPAFAGTFPLGGMLPGGGHVRVSVTSMAEQRFAGIVRQQTDYSCGAAAVATILNAAYGATVSEKEVLSSMLAGGDPELIRARGVSMLDIKQYVENRGMRAAGYRLTVEQLTKLRLPVIVLLNVDGYQHFVVLRKATAETIYIADPALGNRTLAPDAFAKAWNGVILAIVGSHYIEKNVLITVQEEGDPAHPAVELPRGVDPIRRSLLANVFVFSPLYRL